MNFKRGIVPLAGVFLGAAIVTPVFDAEARDQWNDRRHRGPQLCFAPTPYRGAPVGFYDRNGNFAGNYTHGGQISNCKIRQGRRELDWLGGNCICN